MFIGLLLAIVTLALFAPTAWFEFVNYDDTLFVTENAHVQGGFTKANLIWALTNHDAFLWHPLTWFSHMLDFKLYGLKAGGHHLTSVLLHAANAALLFFTLRRLTGARWRSVMVAALFAWHPLHVESVAWVAERKDVLSCFFWMLALWSYCRYVERPGFGRYVMVLVWFALGLMSKPMVVTLPCVLLLLDVWPLRRIALRDGERFAVSWPDVWKLLREKIPMFLLIAISSMVTVAVMSKSGVLKSTTTMAPYPRVANALVAYARYLSDVFWPAKLAVFYPLPAAWPVWQVVGSVGLLLALTVLALRQWRTGAYWAVGWFWFLGTLVPVIGLLQNGDQSMADRYTYIPYIGVFIALVWGAAELVEKRPQSRRALPLAAGMVLLACLVLTSVQLRHWRNTLSLFRHALQVTRDNFTAELIYGDALVEHGNTKDSIEHYREAVRLIPISSKANNNLANAYYMLGNMDESVKYYVRALSIKPDLAKSLHGLGSALYAQGKLTEAAEAYRTALKYKPDYAQAMVSLGTTLVNSGKADEALAAYRQALQYLPDSGEVHAGMGMAYAMKGQLAEAEMKLKHALKLLDNAATRNNLAQVLVELNRPEEAMVQYRAALKLDPNWTMSLNGLAWLLAVHYDVKGRDGATAVNLARRACEATKYQNPTYLNTLAAAYAETGHFSEAVNTAQTAYNLAATTGQAGTANAIMKCLQLYRNNQPYHDPPP